MLVKLLLYNYEDFDEDPYYNADFIKAYHEDNFDKFVNMIQSMKSKIVRVGDRNFVMDDFIFNFPVDKEHIPSIDIYCFEKFD